jgi:hypothetical protein
MSDIREQAIEVAAKASATVWGDPAPDKVDYVVAVAVVDAIIPVIRDDAYAEFQGASEMEVRAWRDDFIAERTESEVLERLRARVKELLQERESDYVKSHDPFDAGAAAALIDVIAVLDGAK